MGEGVLALGRRNRSDRIGVDVWHPIMLGGRLSWAPACQPAMREGYGRHYAKECTNGSGGSPASRCRRTRSSKGAQSPTIVKSGGLLPVKVLI